MRISRITVNHFKSLVNFEIDLARFTCLVGLNGSGKSTVLQLIDFLCQLMRGDIQEWLKERKWKITELLPRENALAPITFAVEIADDSGVALGRWDGLFNTRMLKCEREVLELEGTRFEVSNNSFTTSHTQKTYDITLEYQGSLLARLRDQFLPPPIAEIRQFFQSARTLELLSPRLMRQRTKSPIPGIGRGGERLAGYIHDLPAEQREEIESRLKQADPQFAALVARSVRSGTKVLEIEEAFEGSTFRTEARHLNDGLLRILAILTNIVSSSPLLVFDEIENGINPELVPFVVTSILEAKAQVVVTTHSPLFLNYLPDGVAKEGVIYLYRTRQGQTKSIRFFSIPSMAEKLRVMGPGEVFADTNLVELAEEITGATEPT